MSLVKFVVAGLLIWICLPLVGWAILLIAIAFGF